MRRESIHRHLIQANRGVDFDMYEFPTIQCTGNLARILDRTLNEIPNISSAADWRVRRLIAFIDSQHGKLGWNLNHICSQIEIGISGAHGAKLFKQHTGVGVREYAKTRRLLVAADKLKRTSQSVKEIAVDLGYRNPTDLRRQFKQFFRLSPNEFRTAYRESTECKCVAV